MIGAKLVNAAKAGNTAEVEQYEKAWYANADDIASYLASINPYWDQEQWQTLLYEHLKMTEQEAVDRLQGNYAADIKIYDAIEDDALAMADYMASGIIRQFRI